MKKFIVIGMAALTFLMCCGFRYSSKDVCYVSEIVESEGVARPGVAQVLVLGETKDSAGKFLDVYKDGQIISLPSEQVLNISKAIPLMRGKNKFGGLVVADPEGSKRILIGDSITYFMHEHTEREKDINSWFAQAAMGGEWMQNIALPAITTPNIAGKKIIIALGANDLLGTQGNKCWSTDQFIAFYKSPAIKQLTYLGAKVYVSAVLPVDPGDVNMNKKIVAFNKKIATSLPSYVTFLDSNGHMKAVGYDLIDGLHLTPDTSRKFYAYLMSATAEPGEQISIPVPKTEATIPVDPEVLKAIEEAKAEQAAKAMEAANAQAGEEILAENSKTTKTVKNTKNKKAVDKKEVVPAQTVTTETANQNVAASNPTANATTPAAVASQTIPVISAGKVTAQTTKK